MNFNSGGGFEMDPKPRPIVDHLIRFFGQTQQKLSRMADNSTNRIEQHESQTLRSRLGEFLWKRKPPQRGKQIVEDRIGAEPRGLRSESFARDHSTGKIISNHIVNVFDRPSFFSMPLNNLKTISNTVCHNREMPSVRSVREK